MPVGGGEHDWAALELGAWLSSATGTPLRLDEYEGRSTPRSARRPAGGWRRADRGPRTVRRGRAAPDEPEGCARRGRQPSSELEHRRALLTAAERHEDAVRLRPSSIGVRTSTATSAGDPSRMAASSCGDHSRRVQAQRRGARARRSLRGCKAHHVTSGLRALWRTGRALAGEPHAARSAAGGKVPIRCKQPADDQLPTRNLASGSATVSSPVTVFCRGENENGAPRRRSRIGSYPLEVERGIWAKMARSRPWSAGGGSIPNSSTVPAGCSGSVERLACRPER